MTDVSKCTLSKIGGCSQRIEVHHIDGDPMNNAEENRVPLCGSHHKLVERGRVDLADPKMPEFYVSGGKRRYLYAYSGLTRSEARREAWKRWRARRAS